MSSECSLVVVVLITLLMTTCSIIMPLVNLGDVTAHVCPHLVMEIWVRPPPSDEIFETLQNFMMLLALVVTLCFACLACVRVARADAALLARAKMAAWRGEKMTNSSRGRF